MEHTEAGEGAGVEEVVSGVRAWGRWGKTPVAAEHGVEHIEVGEGGGRAEPGVQQAYRRGRHTDVVLLYVVSHNT